MSWLLLLFDIAVITAIVALTVGPRRFWRWVKRLPGMVGR